MPTKGDRIEVFGILELVLPMGHDIPEQPEAVLRVDNQKLIGHASGDGTMRFRFCPKSAAGFAFKTQSNLTILDKKPEGSRLISDQLLLPNFRQQSSPAGGRGIRLWTEQKNHIVGPGP